MKKIALTLAFILGTSALASLACSCTGDSSPCQSSMRRNPTEEHENKAK